MTLSRLFGLSVREISTRNYGMLLPSLGEIQRIGGRIKVKHEDWIVTEINTKGKLAQISTSVGTGEKLTRKEQKRRAIQDDFLCGFHSEVDATGLKDMFGAKAMESIQELANKEEVSPHIFADLESTQREMLQMQGMMVRNFPHLTCQRCRQDDGSIFHGFDSKSKYRLEVFLRPAYTELLPHVDGSLLKAIFHFFHSGKSECILHHDSNVISTLKGFQQSHFRFLEFSDSDGRLAIRRLDSKLERPYLFCVLQKSGWETFELFQKLADALNVTPNCISSAGIKDSFGVTSQQISIKGVSAEKVQQACLKLGGVRVGNFERGLHPIRHGILKGNHFRIRIRDVPESKQSLQPLMENLPKTFINYFGSQRFRSGIAINAGKYLLQRDFRRAGEAFLDPTKYSDCHWKDILSHFKSTRNAAECISKASQIYSDSVGYQILHKIAVNGESDEVYRDALLELPDKQLLMNIQAFTSYIWNQLVSERLLKSSHPLVGDFLHTSNRKRPICLRGDDLKSCDMENLVFPVYGTRLGEIPEVSDAYDAILKMEKIDVSHFDLSDIFHKSEDKYQLNLFGWYRPIMTKVDHYQFLIEDADESTDVVLSFSLPTSSYASVFLDGLLDD